MPDPQDIYFTPEEKRNIEEQSKDSVLVRRDSPVFMERHPWVGDLARGGMTGLGYAFGSVPGAAIMNYMYNTLQKEKPDWFGYPTDVPRQAIEVGSELLPVAGSKVIKGIKQLPNLKENLVRHFGVSPNKQLIEDAFGNKVGVTGVLDEATQEGIPFTISQISKSPYASRIETALEGGHSLDEFLDKQGGAIRSTMEKTKKQFGLSPDFLTRSESAALVRDKAKGNIAVQMARISEGRKTIHDLAKTALPPKEIITGYTPKTVITQYGRKTIQEPIYETVEAPIILNKSKDYAASTLEELKLILDSPQASPALIKRVKEISDMLTPFAKGRDTVAFAQLDGIRSELGELIQHSPETRSLGNLTRLYKTINEDIGDTLNSTAKLPGKQYTALRSRWDQYRAESHDFLESRYSDVGKMLDPLGFNKMPPDKAVARALSSKEDFGHFMNVATPEGARETLINEMMAKTYAASRFNEGAAYRFLQENRDLFKMASKGDPSFLNRMHRFVNTLQLTARQRGNKGALQSMGGQAEKLGEIGGTGLAEGSGLYIARAISGGSIYLGRKMFGKMMLDKELSENLIRLAKEEAGSFGADVQLRQLIKNATKKGFELTTPAGAAVVINPRTGKLEEGSPAPDSTIERDANGRTMGTLLNEPLQ